MLADWVQVPPRPTKERAACSNAANNTEARGDMATGVGVLGMMARSSTGAVGVASSAAHAGVAAGTVVITVAVRDLRRRNED